MPRRKKVVSEEEAQKNAVEAVAEKTQNDDLLKGVMEKLAELQTVNEKLAAENAELRRVALPAEGGRRLVRGENESDFELPKAEEPLPMTDMAVFRSPNPGFKQVIKRSVDRWNGNEKTTTAPVIAEFTRGVCVLYDEEEIELMREKYAQKKRKGVVDYVEVVDAEAKRAALSGTRHIVSEKVTTDTPLMDVIQ